jgi:CheY-like chemotaxis protein
MPPHAQYSRIVLINQSKEENQEVVTALSNLQYVIECFSSGNEALEFLENEPTVDAVICDLNLDKHFTGLDFAQIFRKNPVYTTTPLLFITDTASADDIKSGIMFGADDYIVRPLSPEALSTSLKTTITRSEKLSIEREVFGKKINSQDDLFKEISILNSHHIRGPLSNVMGIIDQLEDEIPNNNQVVQDLKFQINEIERIIRLVAGRLNNYKGNKDYRFRYIQNAKDTFKIMFLDDDDIQLKIVRSMIERYYPNVQIEISSLIGHAIDKIQNGEYDLVISDLNMPKISGFEVVEILNQTRPDIPVIILTSSLHNEDVMRAINFPNVYQFLHKPLSKQSFSKIFSEN